MRNISDIIEQFLKTALEFSDDGVIEVQRSELAEKFQVVPSQINYVISTRFSLEKGFSVESKRGGGGYIRIKKLEIESNDSFYKALNELIGSEIAQSQAITIIERLKEEKIINENEYSIIKSIISREVLSLPLPIRDQIRSNILKATLRVIFSK
ncbi:CtsR family transcriptional regulator [Tepidibacillus decaturensis]|uniref:Transcriptional regulator CtsR n=1 Tax=Tepidibacillus decaturensis TaxID=1413211 RepID=A0A135L799_9BACI|nr:CtsR family transcriptional regulator [Tepidibacillus decaturensis]KXG44868.1 CtsR family transcriptional regulator [Tepidibacillus decaturensis]